MCTLALFEKESDRDDRGKTYFMYKFLIFFYIIKKKKKSKEQFQEDLSIVGNSFFRLLLECIYVWNNWFPNSAFSEYYLKLK